MKRLLTLLTILISVNCFGQVNKVEGFAGVKFLDSKISAIKYLTTRFKKPPLKVEKDKIGFVDVNIGGSKVDAVLFMFYEDKFYSSTATFSPDINTQVISLYNSISKDISYKYTNPIDEKEEYLPPYEKGDGYYVDALRLGKLTKETTWNLRCSVGGECNIIESIKPDCSISLNYFYIPIATKAFKELNDKDRNDF